eukprot:GHVL01022459.1.p1 GENE.GHVL01022459.1~~GHVL01022459.1.p1  ORF type:complete len:218 (+),score=42.41 GHVL01022459.1:54-707(+)
MIYLYQNNPNYELVDSLPYVDSAPDLEMKEIINEMINEEMKLLPKKDYIASLPMPLLNESPLVSFEMDRLSKGRPFATFDLKKYDSIDGPTSGRVADVLAWEMSLKEARIAIEHQQIRLDNLELASKFCNNTWSQHAKDLEMPQKLLEGEVKELRQKVDDINKKRKLEQIDAGGEFRTLTQEWDAGMAENGELERVLLEEQQKVTTLTTLAIERELG